MSYIDDLLLYASADDLEEVFAPRRRVNPFQPVMEIQVSIEQRTRTEVIKALIAVSDALALILTEREVGPAPDLPAPVDTAPPAPKPPKAKKEKAPAPAPEPKPELPIPTVGEKMEDIKPVKPGKTLADLRVALQACITTHGMAAAKERLTPYTKVSDVPDEAIGDVIKALSA